MQMNRKFKNLVEAFFGIHINVASYNGINLYNFWNVNPHKVKDTWLINVTIIENLNNPSLRNNTREKFANNISCLDISGIRGTIIDSLDKIVNTSHSKFVE